MGLIKIIMIDEWRLVVIVVALAVLLGGVGLGCLLRRRRRRKALKEQDISNRSQQSQELSRQVKYSTMQKKKLTIQI